MPSNILAALNVILLILCALGCYLLWFALDSNQSLSQQVTEGFLGGLLLLMIFGFMFGIASPLVSSFLNDAAESKQLWDYTEEGIRSAWYGICLGVGLIACALIALELWPIKLAGWLGADPLNPPPFVPSAMLLAFAVMFTGFGQIPPNGIIGYRTPASFKSPDNWQRVHSLAQKIVPIPAAIAGVIMLFLPNAEWLIGLAVAIILVLIIIPGVIVSRSSQS